MVCGCRLGWELVEERSKLSCWCSITFRLSYQIRQLPYSMGFQNAITCRFKYHRSRNYCPFHSFARSDSPTESPTRTPGLCVPCTIYQGTNSLSTFEDNAACIEVATSETKIRPRTKHLAVCFSIFEMTLKKGLSQSNVIN